MKIELRQMIMSAIFTALMIVAARTLSIPTPFGVPITFQLFFCVYAGLLLGAKAGLLSQIVYILIGFTGLPVFVGGGGIDYVLRPTFGYILGFALAAFIIGLMMDRMKQVTFIKVLIVSVIGYLAIYIIGNLYFYGILNLYVNKPITLIEVFRTMGLYMLKDLVLLIIAASTATVIIPILRKAGYIKAA